MKKIFKFVFISLFFFTPVKSSSYGSGELTLSPGMVDYFIYYLRIKPTPMAFYVTTDGMDGHHWICPEGNCQTHNVGKGARTCEQDFDKPCKLFARMRDVKWKNGINPGKGKQSRFKGKWTDEEIIAKLTDLGFIGGYSNNTSNQSNSSESSSSDSSMITDDTLKKLKELKKLLDEGILTEEEFTNAKKKLLK